MAVRKDILLKVLKLLVLLFWPLGFLFANSSKDLLFFFFPNIGVLVCYYLYKRANSWWAAPLLVVGVINGSLSVFPLVVALTRVLHKRRWQDLLVLLLAVVIFLYQIHNLYLGSVFKYDRDTYQQKIEQGYLYPNVLLARISQNKWTIFTGRVRFNFFALIDPNNYFFNFHPREIVRENQNLDKYPFWAIVFFAIGLFGMIERKGGEFILVVLAGLLINLSMLRSFDRYDLALYFPVSLIVVFGLGKLRSWWIEDALIVITVAEGLHLLLQYG